MPKNELKPCPFCGFEALEKKEPMFHDNTVKGGRIIYGYRIMCSSCRITTDQSLKRGLVIRQWNRRTNEK